MRQAVQSAVHLARAFWSPGADVDPWLEHGWEVIPLHPGEAKDRLQVAIIGPGGANGSVRADVFVYSARCEARARDPIEQEISEVALRRPAVKSVLIKYAHCKLFKPLTDDEVWTRAQLGVWFLQRDWTRTDEDVAWVWQQCLQPAVRLCPGGRGAIDRSLTGYELQEALVKNYVNPLGPGGFRAYVRAAVRRLIQAERRGEGVAKRYGHADSNADTIEAVFGGERFRSFLRQRKHRGDPGLVTVNGRLRVTPEAWERLTVEYAELACRRILIKEITDGMVEVGADRQSAERQVRRWLADSLHPLEARRKFGLWLKRKRVRG